MNEETTIDELKFYELKLMQPRDGYRYSLDPLLLCAFAGAQANGKTIVDLGCGCGIMPLLMDRHYGAAAATGIELQEEMARLAERNVTLNGAGIQIIHDDILNIRRRFRVSSFDLVLANPPFRNPGTGKISPRKGRDTARHETTARLTDFLAAAKYLVSPAGSIFFVYLPARLQEFMATSAELKLSVSRLRMVHGRVESEARIFLAELKKGRKCNLAIEPPLVVYQDDGTYTPEAQELLGS